MSERLNQTRGQTLSFIVAHSSPLGQPTSNGPDYSPDSHGSPQQSETKRLNPYFVEWLMGWPAGWTSPTVQPDFAPEAMESYRLAQRAQLSCLFAAPESFKDAT